MDDYETIAQIGQGSYGVVLRATRISTGEEVAIKRLNREYSNWKECSGLPEVVSLRFLSHPNIVKLFGIVKSNNRLHLIFEHMKSNLYEVIKLKSDHGEVFHQAHIRNIMFQVLSAVAYIHSRGYIHRDLKPENILVTLHTIKIADFGQCVATVNQSFQSQSFYVATRWYRAPELLLKEQYDSAIDIWAVGCIMAELFQLRALFPGKDETEQLNIIINTFESNKLFPVSGATPLAIDLMKSLLQWKRADRISAAEALEHPYFSLSSC